MDPAGSREQQGQGVLHKAEQVTGWYDHRTIELGGRYVAAAEYFKDNRPLRGGIVSARRSTAAEAEAERDRRKFDA